MRSDEVKNRGCLPRSCWLQKQRRSRPGGWRLAATLACLALLGLSTTDGLAAETPRAGSGALPADIAPDDILAVVERQLVPATPETIATARDQALTALTAMEQTLASQAVGVLLREELLLQAVRDAVSQLSPSPTPAEVATLAAFVPVLRRVLPGQAGDDLSRLRAAITALAAIAGRTPDALAAAQKAAATLRGHLAAGTAAVSAEDDRAVRAAFADIARLVPDATDRRLLRQLLSQPNAVVQLRREFVQQMAQQQFTTPVDLRRVQAGAVITGHGEVQVELTAALPERESVCELIVLANGGGPLAMTATTDRARVTASAVPTVVGRQPIEIGPQRIDPGLASIDAAVTTRLDTLSISGLLGRCRLVRRLASRAVQRQLAANDPVAARELEAAVAEEVREQGLQLAARINTLLSWGVWDRMAAIDFSPSVALATRATGLSSRTFYARGDQLGALAPPPAIPPEVASQLAILTQVHQSAINNVFATFGGLTLDEATIRALFEVQLKLADDAWEQLPPARVASAITFAADRPLEVHFADNRLKLVLRPAAGSLAGRPLDGCPTEIRVRYRLDQDDRGLVFRREACEPDGSLDAATAEGWAQLIDLFLGRNLRPLPKYQTSGVAARMNMIHARLERGWLTVAAAATPAPHTSEPQP